MTLPIQNPDATLRLQQLYDIVGKLEVKLDEIISPVAIVDDGWKLVTFIEFNLSIPASTASSDRPFHEPSPDFQFQLLYLEVIGTGNLTGAVKPAIERQNGSQLIYNAVSLLGVQDPENLNCFEMTEAKQPTAPPNTFWLIDPPATGVGETLEITALMAQIPRGIRPIAP